MEKLLRRMNAPRFLTLTLADDGESLSARLDRLHSAWRRLRKTLLWKQCVTGGVYGVQITRGERGKHWHVHLHCVIDGEFMPQAEIAEIWQEITGDSRVVDIRAVHDRKKQATYVAAYVTKPNDLAEWSDADLVEYATAMHGRRTLHTFGSMHGANPDEQSAEAEKSTLRQCVSLRKLEDDAASGCPIADWCMTALGRSHYMARLAFNEPHQQPMPGALPPLDEAEKAALAYMLRKYYDGWTDDTPIDVRWRWLRDVARRAEREAREARKQRTQRTQPQLFVS